MVTLNFQNVFRVDNVFEKAKIADENLTSVFPEKIIIDMVNNHKSSYVHISIYDTSLKFKSQSELEILKGLNTKANVCILFAPFPEVFFNNPHMEILSNDLIIGNRYHRIHGTYIIFLIFCYVDEQAKKEAPLISKSLANHIRLTYGIGAVGECIYQGYYSKNDDSVFITANFNANLPEKRVDFDVSSFEKFSLTCKIEIKEFLLNGEAEILFNRAVLEEDIETRFLFLWLSFDSMCHGKERKKLFLDHLNSCIANDEVLRLFDLRNEIAHGGKAIIDAKDCTSAFWAIRIAVCPNQEIQKHICLEYEKWITS